MKILIIGSGGREHALAWKVAQSPQVEHVWVAPGNGGTASESNISNIDIPATAVADLLSFAQNQHIDLTIVGPETALEAGIVDQFQKANLKCFGPTAKAAQLETSKAYSKAFMAANNIPTAEFQSFTDEKKALAYIQQHSFPLVIKADGLAAGKGVFIPETLAQATEIVHELLGTQSLGKAGQRIIIEEYLTGQELSFIVMTDGEHVLPLASAQDHKRRDNNNMGPNTGGMGAFSPVPLLTPQLEQHILQDIFAPTLNALQKDQIPYVGFLYAGLMITPTGKAKVLEFNCRLGDPEAQVILMRLQSDLVDLCLHALKGTLNKAKPAWDKRHALTIVLASKDYPYQYPTQEEIIGLNNLFSPSTKIFHAGTLQQNKQIITNGGRVLSVTALGDNLEQARQQAYTDARLIHWPHCFYRTDIGAIHMSTSSII